MDASAALTASRRRRRRLRLRDLEGYAFLWPSFIGFFLFVLVPVVAALGISFTNWDLVNTPSWVGVQNYQNLIRTDPIFKDVVRNTLLFTLVTVPARVVFSLLLAVLLNQGVRGIGLFRTAYFMPVVAPVVATALVWAWILDGTFGLLNFLLLHLGVQRPPNWLQSTTWALPAIMIFSVWKNVGFTTIIYLAGLQNIPSELYEAASLDGAGRFGKFRYVTVPLVSPTTFFVLIISLIFAFQVFEESFVMTNGGPANATTTIVFDIYETGFKYYNMGTASALAWILFAIILVVTLVQLVLQRRWVHYG
ncbi:MAG: sugar ABC transporter permease [Candidatus Dormiibacterota bacterium]